MQLTPRLTGGFSWGHGSPKNRDLGTKAHSQSVSAQSVGFQGNCRAAQERPRAVFWGPGSRAADTKAHSQSVLSQSVAFQSHLRAPKILQELFSGGLGPVQLTPRLTINPCQANLWCNRPISERPRACKSCFLGAWVPCN